MVKKFIISLKERWVDILLIATICPLMVAILLYYAAIPSRVSATEEKVNNLEDTMNTSIPRIENHLLIIRCLNKDKIACLELKHEKSKRE